MLKTVKLKTSKFDRVAKEDIGSVIRKGDTFALEDGYYFNEDESIIFKSTDKTGKLFAKKYEQT